MVLVSSGASDTPVAPSAEGRSDFSADVGVYRRAQADAETARSTAVTLSMRGAHQGPFHVAPFGGVVLALWAKYGKKQQAAQTAQPAAQQGEERVTVREGRRDGLFVECLLANARRCSVMISSVLRPLSILLLLWSVCCVTLIDDKVVGLLEAWVGDRAALQATTDLHTLRAAVKVLFDI